jgi:hypothetical protein
MRFALAAPRRWWETPVFDQLFTMLAWHEAFGDLPRGAAESVEARREDIERVADDAAEVARIVREAIEDGARRAAAFAIMMPRTGDRVPV